MGGRGGYRGEEGELHHTRRPENRILKRFRGGEGEKPVFLFTFQGRAREGGFTRVCLSGSSLNGWEGRSSDLMLTVPVRIKT